MSNTGTYKWDSEKRKVVKISDRVSGSLTYSDVTFTKPFWTSDITGQPEYIDSRHKKKVLMEKHGVQEVESSRDKTLRSSNRHKPKGCTKEFVKRHLDKLHGPLPCLR